MVANAFAIAFGLLSKVIADGMRLPANTAPRGTAYSAAMRDLCKDAAQQKGGITGSPQFRRQCLTSMRPNRSITRGRWPCLGPTPMRCCGGEAFVFEQVA